MGSVQLLQLPAVVSVSGWWRMLVNYKERNQVTLSMHARVPSITNRMEQLTLIWGQYRDVVVIFFFFSAVTAWENEGPRVRQTPC